MTDINKLREELRAHAKHSREAAYCMEEAADALYFREKQVAELKGAITAQEGRITELEAENAWLRRGNDPFTVLGDQRVGSQELTMVQKPDIL